MQLDARKLQVLSAIVEGYIRTGEPVGSKMVCEMLETPVSSATVRNEMAALSELGMIEQPHTSAGRIPSQKGYRFYVDHLMNRQELSSKEKESIQQDLRLGTDPASVIQNAAKELAQVTGCAAITTTPTPRFAHIRRIEAVYAGRKTLVLILITSAGVIKSKICRLDFHISSQEIEKLNQFLNEHFVNLPLEQITPALVQTLAAKLSAHSLVLTPVLKSVYELYREVFEGKFLLEGSSNLLNALQEGPLAFEFLKYILMRKDLPELLNREFPKTSVLIGDKLRDPALSASSVIVAQYNIGDITGGKIGIIGPTRIDYARLIPRIEYFAQMVGSILTNILDEE